MSPSEAPPRDRPFDGWRVPASREARELIAEAIQLIETHEHRHGLRIIARSPKHQARFEAAVAALVCDLAHHHLRRAGDDARPAGDIAITLDNSKLGRRSRYKCVALNDSLPDLLDRMHVLGIASVQVGWHDLKPRPDRPRFRQTTMRAGRWLCERIEGMGLSFADLGRDAAEELIILKGNKRPRLGGSLKADLMEYADDAHTMRLREEMRAINGWLAQADLALAGSFPHVDTSERRLRRVFNNGRFDHGGRLSGGWWTGLPKTIKREHVRIAGERVALLDYSCLYARLAYARVGIEAPPGDLYTCIPGLGAHRKGAQTLLNALLFDRKRRTRKPKRTLERLPRGVPIGALIATIERTHAPIAKLFGRGAGFELMHMESTLMVRVLLRLRDLGIVGLPVHDALIVARSVAQAAADVMMTIAEEVAGCRLPTTIDVEDDETVDDDLWEDDQSL